MLVTDIPFGERSRAPSRRHWGGPVVGGFYLSMGGVHLGVVAAAPETYRHFADGALLEVVRRGWIDVFMAAPVLFGLLLAAGETLLGVLLLSGARRAATLGWAGAMVFHLVLMLFGLAFWAWCVPALVLLVVCARQDPSFARPPRHRAGRHRSDQSGPLHVLQH